VATPAAATASAASHPPSPSGPAQESARPFALAPPDVAAPPADAERSASGLAWKVLEHGQGADHPKYQDKVMVHYTGWTTDGKMFDSSVQRQLPTKFPLRGVIPGWTEGLQLMVVGEKRRFWIPEELSYAGQPGKPAGMLVFDVQLLEIIPGPLPIPPPADVAAPPADAIQEKSGVSWRTIREGSGAARPTPAAWVTFHFTAWSQSGLMLQSSVENQRPLTIAINQGVPAWQEALPEMRVGEKRLVWSPEALGFNRRYGIKPGELTLFELELISFTEPPPAPPDVSGPPETAETSASGLASRVLLKGQGQEHPGPNTVVTIEYSGWTTDGKLFDGTFMRNRPATFTVSKIIAGLTEGVQLMVVGEKRRFWIPPRLAYEGIPEAPQGTLVMDVELVSMEASPATP
jgi:FKBP-type peptidyl-prolyl cis-trans isomerase